jgi:hypothetical protein
MRSASEKAAAVSAARKHAKQMERRAGAKKDFETQHSGVFATPGLPLAQCSTAESGIIFSAVLAGGRTSRCRATALYRFPQSDQKHHALAFGVRREQFGHVVIKAVILSLTPVSDIRST